MAQGLKSLELDTQLDDFESQIQKLSPEQITEDNLTSSEQKTSETLDGLEDIA